MCSAVFSQVQQPAVVLLGIWFYARAVAGVQPVAASNQGPTVVDPDRSPCTSLPTNSARASSVFRIAPAAVFPRYLKASVISSSGPGIADRCSGVGVSPVWFG